MHELSIAAAVLDLALRSADGLRVTKVRLQVGHLRQVVPSALLFSWELVAQDTRAEGAVLELEEVPAAGLCRACGGESTLREFPLRCGPCGSLDIEVVRGEELLVEWVEVEENADEHAGEETMTAC